MEAIGSLAGGIVVSFVFIQWLSILQSLILLLLIVLIIFTVMRKKQLYAIFSALVLSGLIMTFVFPVDNIEKSFLFTHQHVLITKETWYGNITITENAGQYAVFENGSLLFTTQNMIANEEYVHAGRDTEVSESSANRLC